MNEIGYTVGAETEKLRPCEVSLYRKTFLARLNHGASVEGADKQGLHACKVWEKRGALNDDEVEGADESSSSARFGNRTPGQVAFESWAVRVNKKNAVWSELSDEARSAWQYATHLSTPEIVPPPTQDDDSLTSFLNETSRTRR